MVDPVRYKPIPIEWASGPGVFMDDVPDGNWVKYEDHKKIVEELEKQLKYWKDRSESHRPPGAFSN